LQTGENKTLKPLRAADVGWNLMSPNVNDSLKVYDEALKRRTEGDFEV
jgi:hypothetical protein